MRFIRYALLFGLAVGGSAAVAAFAYSIQLGVLVKVDELYGSTSSGMWMATAMLSLFLAFPAFLLGTAAVGGLAWMVRGRAADLMSRISAAMVGALSATVSGGLLFTALFGVGALIFTAPLPVAGALGGIVFRRVLLKGLAILRPPPAPPA